MPRTVYFGTWSPLTCEHKCSIVRAWTDDLDAPKDWPFVLDGVPGHVTAVHSFPRVPDHPMCQMGDGHETRRHCRHHAHLSDPHEHFIACLRENQKRDAAWNAAVEHLGSSPDVRSTCDDSRTHHLYVFGVPSADMNALRAHLDACGHADVVLHHGGGGP